MGPKGKHPVMYKGHAPLPGCGRPKGVVANPRTVAINAIFEVMNKDENQKKFKEKLQSLFDQAPIGFYKELVEPLQPREYNLTIDSTHSEIKASVDLTKLSMKELEQLERIVDKATPDKDVISDVDNNVIDAEVVNTQATNFIEGLENAQKAVSSMVEDY